MSAWRGTLHKAKGPDCTREPQWARVLFERLLALQFCNIRNMIPEARLHILDHAKIASGNRRAHALMSIRDMTFHGQIEVVSRHQLRWSRHGRVRVLSERSLAY